MKSGKFALCIHNDGYEASLERRKIYRVVPNKKAAENDLLCVVDESKQAYLYPARCFAFITLSHNLLKAMALAA